MPLKPSMGIKAYIKDFQKSDAPQFKGKSKEQRRDQAVAAYLQAKDDMKEGVGAGKYSTMNLKKAKQLMSPAKHREDGVKRIMKGMKVTYKQANKFHDDVMKSHGFKAESTKRVTQVSLDQAKRDLKMKKIQKKMKSLDEISVAKRNKYYDDAKKSIDRAKSSAVGKILRGKEADGTRHDHSIELRTMARREKGIKTAKNQAIKNIRGELYKKKTEAMDPMMLGKMQAQAAASQKANQKKRDEEEKKAMAKKASKPTNEMTMGQGVQVVKTAIGERPKGIGWSLKKLGKQTGKDHDVWHRKTKGVAQPKIRAGSTMYNDTTTEKLDHQDKPLVKKVVGMLKKASKAHAGQAKSLSKAMTDEGYIKSDKIHPHPQAKLTKVQRRALTALDKRAKKPVTLPGMDMLKKKEKEPTKVGRQSQIVRYEEKGRGPTGIAYSLPKGHPDAENPATRKKYPERQTAKYKRDFAKNSPIKLSGKFSTNENAFRPPHMTKKDVDMQKANMQKANPSALHNIKIKQSDKDKLIKIRKMLDKEKKPVKQNESVNEVSMKTLGNYIKKRTYDIGSAGGRMGADFGIGPEEKKKNRAKAVSDYVKYQKGTKTAVDKLTGKAKVPATKESTWYMPTSREMVVLRNMMKRPIALGENAENAIDNISIGSDTLHNIFVAEAKKDPNTDARTMIESWLSDRLKHGDEEAEYLGIRLGLLEGYEADVSKFMNKHDIDHHWSGGKLHVDQKDEKRAMKKLSKKYGGYGPRGAKMMPQVHVKK